MPLSEKMADDFFNDFLKKYRPAASIAVDQVEYTSTIGWLRLVEQFRNSQQEQSDCLANDLAAASQLFRDRTPNDDSIKQIKGVVKIAESVRDARNAFVKGVVDRVKLPAEECDRLIAKVLHDASVKGTTEPLHFEGLLDYVQKRIDAEITKYSWDSQKWIVVEEKPEKPKEEKPKKRPKKEGVPLVE